MAKLKVKHTVSFIDDVETDDFDANYTTEDLLEECRANSLEVINTAAEQDLAHITTELVNGT